MRGIHNLHLCLYMADGPTAMRKRPSHTLTWWFMCDRNYACVHTKFTQIPTSHQHGLLRSPLLRRVLVVINPKLSTINTCHISIQLVKRFCKFVDLMLTSCNAIVRHFVRRAINSAQSPIGRNIAVIRHRYAICVQCSRH